MVLSVSVPTVITMEEYRAHWEPQGWQLVIVGPTSTWRQEWGEWEAIRDIVQNALDEAEAYQWGYDDKGLWISDRGRGIAVADLLLGPPRLKSSYARGKYGEGMKVAALALVRKGYPVHVETPGKELWLVFLKVSLDAGREAEQLVALWRAAPDRQGTRFHIVGYTGSAFPDRFAVNLPRKAELASGPSKLTQPVRRFNQLLDPGFTVRPRIYARDIYMRDIDSPFSYNLSGFDMAPDRHGAKDERQMWLDMGRLWCCVTRVSLKETLLRMVCEPPLIKSEEGRSLSMSQWDMGVEPVTNKPYADFVKEDSAAWKEAWANVFGSNVVIRTTDRWDGTVKHLGYTSVSLSWQVQDTLALAITTDADLVKASQERLREAQVIPDERLSPKQSAHLKLARAICEEVSPGRKVGGVHAAIIPPASDRVRTAGMYSRTTEEIFIASDQLERGRSSVDTVIHELAHHLSGAEDLEEKHAAEMTRVAARVVEATSRGDFDELMKEAVW